MKKSDLLQRLDADFPDKPVGFCYARTRNSHVAEDLCSDILFRLVRAAQGDGDITHGHAFIWRIAQNAYADFCARRRTENDRRCTDDTV